MLRDKKFWVGFLVGYALVGMFFPVSKVVHMSKKSQG